MTTLKQTHEEVLDLEDDPLYAEDPIKLMVLSNNSTLLYLRNENKRGVKIISLEDGA
jgi:hypothetical protein